MKRNQRNDDPHVGGEPNAGLNAAHNIALGRAQVQAEKIADDPRRVDEVILNARARQGRLRAAAGNFLMNDFFDMIDMLKHVHIFPLRRGTHLLILGSLIYVASPIDLIPDLIPVVGSLDDIAILSLTVTQIKREITDFRRWRAHERIRREQQLRQREDICPNCVIA